MHSLGRSRGMMLFVAGVALTASAQLNPTVAVLPKAAAPVPIECEQGLAPQKTARLDVSQLPEAQTSPAENVAPPSAALRATLLEAQAAGERSNRNAFVDALARAKELLASYPPGAERTAAADVVKVLDDVDHVWTYQFESPTGAFFDASSPLLATLRGYPGYEAAVADDVIETGGRRLYPSRESRLFLLRESSRRLARLGVRGGSVIAERPGTGRAPRVVVKHPGSHPSPAVPENTESAPSRVHGKSTSTSPTKKHSTKSATASTTSKTTTRQHEKGSATTKQTSHREPVKIVEATPPPTHSASRTQHEMTSAAPTPQRKVVQPEPRTTHHEARSTKHEARSTSPTATHSVPPPAPAPRTTNAPAGSMTATTSSAPPPPTSAPATTAPASSGARTTATAPLTNTASTSSGATSSGSTSSAVTSSAVTSSAAATSTSTTVAPTPSDTTATTSSAPAPAPAQPGRTRSVVLPILLILVGVGVLVVLFRASS